MIIKLRRNQLKYFRAKARKHAPNEIMAFLYGYRVAPNLLEVHRIDFPKLETSTPGEVIADVISEHELDENAKDDGFCYLGSVHTHTGHNAPIFMSKSDLKNHKERGESITGICEVGAKRCFIAFWQLNTPLPCNWEYF